jgi:hypothetical protein
MWGAGSPPMKQTERAPSAWRWRMRAAKLCRGDRRAVGWVEGKAGRGAEAAARGAAAEKDGVRRAQQLLLAVVQHLAGDITATADATDASRIGAARSAVKRAEVAIGQVRGGARG